MSAPDANPIPPYLPGAQLFSGAARALDVRLLNAAAWALEHFEATDRANACIHMSQVRYSPITFELAKGLKDNGGTGAAIDAVLAHLGRYPLDPGRVADDKV